MNKIFKMIAIFISLSTFFASISFGSSLHVIDAEKAQKSSYLSAELDGPIPFWIVDGNLVSLAEARDLVFNQQKIACTSWLMNYSDNKKVTKHEIQNSLLKTQKMIPLWKKISGKAVFVDDSTNFAVSYNCVRKDVNNSIVEIEFLTDFDFNSNFRGVLEILPGFSRASESFLRHR